MKYWELSAPGVLNLEHNNTAIVPEGYAKVKVQLVCLTASDIDAYLGEAEEYPLTIGRQAVGYISEIGENNRILTRGQRVVVDPRITCGACYACKNNRPTVCENGRIMGLESAGMLSDFAIVPVRNLYPLPPHVKNEDALYVEPLAMANRIFTEANMAKGAHAVIFGSSSLGILLAQVLIYQQIIPIIIDSHDENLEYARKHGIYYTINSGTGNVISQIKQLTSGRLCEHSIYLSSGGEKPQDALDCLQQGGTLVLAGYSGKDSRSNVKIGSIFNKQLRVIGINNGGKYIESAINLIAKHEVNLSTLPVKELDFDELPSQIKPYAEEQNFLHRLVVKFS